MGALKNQVFSGDEKFVRKMQCLIEPDRSLDKIPQNQKRKVAQSLQVYEQMASSRDEAIYSAFMSGGYKMKEIGEYYGLHYSTVSKVIKEVGLIYSRFKT